MKRALGSIDLAAIVAELKRRLAGAIVSNVYQSGRIFIFRLHTKDGKVDLVFEPGRRLHLTKYEYPRPEQPPPFCAMLRRLVRRGVIEDISQPDLERVVLIDLRTPNGRRRLALELVREGNLLVLDDSDKIMLALEPKKMRDRELVPGARYELPPRRAPDLLRATLDEIKRALEGAKGDIVRNMVTRLGIQGEAAEEICRRLGIPKDKPVNEVTDDELRAIKEEFARIYEEALRGRGYLIISGGEPVGVAPFKISAEDVELRECETFNDAVDEFFSRITVEELARVAEERISEEEAKVIRELEELRRRAEEYRRRAERMRKLGDLVYANMHLLLPVAEQALRLLGELRDPSKVIEHVRDLCPAGIEPVSLDGGKKQLLIKIHGESVILDLSEGVPRSAGKYYERAKKAEQKLKTIEELLRQKEEELRRLRERARPSAPKLRMRAARREWYERFRWFISSDGFLVIAGKDAKQNRMIVRRYMEPKDIFLHAEIHGAPATVIKLGGREPTQRTIEEAAQFAAAYSRAWREGLAAADVYWVWGEQVSLAAPAGEYLPRGSVMVRGKRNYIRGVPLRAAIGILRDDQGPRLMAGPPSAVKARCDPWVEVVPGSLSKRELAQRVLAKLKELADEEARAFLDECVRVEDVEGLLPPGGGRIADAGSSKVRR